MTNRVITYEMRSKGYDVFKNARNLKQLNDTFSRLYSTPKEYDLMRTRKRIDGTLKPIGVKKYAAPDDSPEGILFELFNIHKRTDLYVLCSGGKDSICLAHYISTHHPDKFKGLIFIDTGVGIKKTEEWLKKYTKEMGWKLHIVSPDPYDVYFARAKAQGFPGAGAHNITMMYLKYYPLRKFMFSDPQRKYNGVCVSGTRKFESNRRGINTTAIDADGNLMFVSPFFTKTDEYVYKYLIENGLKRTPVHDILGMSGECMCGCYAGVGEREIIKDLDPSLEQKLSDAERHILEQGTDEAKKCGIWGRAKKYTKTKVDPNVEAIICGTECGGSTMRGTEAI